MKLNKYQDVAMSYRLPTANVTYAILGLVGEVGELYSSMAKQIRDGVTDEDFDNTVKELGDILWFVAAVAQDCGLTLEEIAKLNLEKLEGRKNRGTIQGKGDDR